MTKPASTVLKSFTILLSLILFIICAGLIIIKTAGLEISPLELVGLTISFSFASAVALVIFFIGLTRPKTDQPFYSLVAISLKFLLEMVIALIWFLTAKKTGIPCILLFFVLYLTFTMFSVIMILNTLKKKSL